MSSPQKGTRQTSRSKGAGNGTKASVSTAPVSRGGGDVFGRFMALFDGYEKAYGTYTTGRADEKGKVQGKAETKRGQIGREQFTGHLEGTGPGIGIVPLKADDTVRFGVIDYDVTTMDHAKAEQAVRTLGLPLVLCRSKSGGGHFYCFTAEPEPAGVMQERLTEWAALLGMSSKTEKFPKQSTRYNDDDIGNWINLPYFNAESTVRYGYVDGKAATLEEFVEFAESMRVPTEVMHTSATRDTTSADDLFHEGPPCLQMLHSRGGFEAGTRNDGMTAVVVYLKKRYPDDWQTRVDVYNQAMANLGSAEIQTIIKSLTRKEYEYRCKLAPINSFCQRKKCLTRQYGVGEAGALEGKGVAIQSITRYDSAHGDEPMWGLDLNGRRVMVSNSQFYSRDEFNKACMAQANVVPVHVTPSRWLKMLHEMISSAQIVPMPEDAGPTGQLWYWVESFLMQNVDAKVPEEVTLGKPFRDHTEKLVYFRSQDLFRYLDARKVQYKSHQAVWSKLRDKGGETAFWKFGAKGVNVWVLPMPDEAPDQPATAGGGGDTAQGEDW